MKAELEKVREYGINAEADVVIDRDLWKSRAAKYREGLQQSQEDLHSEFCGTSEHEVCMRAQEALKGGRSVSEIEIVEDPEEVFCNLALSYDEIDDFQTDCMGEQLLAQIYGWA